MPFPSVFNFSVHIFLCFSLFLKKRGDGGVIQRVFSSLTVWSIPSSYLAQVYQNIRSQALSVSNPKHGLKWSARMTQTRIVRIFITFASGLSSSFLFNLPCYCFSLNKVGFALCQFAFFVPLPVTIAHLRSIKPQLCIAQT